jgi:hypothetical protein
MAVLHEHSERFSAVKGKISWFNDNVESTASGQKGGIAVYNQQTLGGWWLVKLPNGAEEYIKQTDIGPAPWTGRKFDFSQNNLEAIGYTTGNFPTDSEIEATYVGKQYPVATKNANPHIVAIPVKKGGGLYNVGENPYPQKTKKGGCVNLPIVNAPIFPEGFCEAFEHIGKVFEFIGSTAGWVRIGKVTFGAILLLIALAELGKIGSGSSSNIKDTAQKVAIGSNI